MPTIYWLCPHCGQADDNKDLAAECCQPAPEQRWLCEECKASYGSLHDAIKCELAHLPATTLTVDELYDANYAEWQKRQDLLAAIQAQVKAWRQENENVSAMLRDCIFSQSQQLGIVAHMHERAKCANALEDIWQAHRDKGGE